MLEQILRYFEEMLEQIMGNMQEKFRGNAGTDPVILRRNDGIRLKEV